VNVNKRLIWFLSLLIINSTSYAITFVDAKIDGVAGIDGLAGASAVVASPDGQNVYATGFNDNALVVFKRNPTDGLLTFMQSINNTTLGVNGLSGANGVVVSPDNKHVYVASYKDSAVVVFNRDMANGTLSLVEIQQNGISNNTGLSGANAIAFSPDNLRVYVTGAIDDALTAYSRDPQTGALTLLAMHKDGLNNVDGLDGPTGVTVSSDGYIYVTSPLDNSVAVFSRSPSVGELAFIAVYKNNVGGVTGLRGAYSAALSPDNNALYVASNTDNAIIAFQRVTGGGLTYLASYSNGKESISGLSGVRGVAVTNNQVYAISTSDSAIVVFNRELNTHLLTFNSVLKNGSQNITTLNGASALTISPDNAHIYTTALLSHAVSLFSVVSSDLSLTMTEYPIVAINTELNYALTITNNGPSQATDVTVVDNLPSGVTNVIATSSSGNCNHDTVTHNITCLLNSLDVNANAKITLTMTSPSSVGNGSLVNKATASSGQPDGNAANNTITQTTSLQASVPTADLQLKIDSIADPVGVNNEVTYKITTNNNGPDNATSVKVVHTLPTSMTYVSSNDAQCNYQLATHKLTCNYATLATESLNNTEIIVDTPSVTSTEEIILTSTVTSSEFDPVQTNNNAMVSTHVSELNIDLAITNAYAEPDSISVGNYLTYHVTIVNQSETAATGSLLTATLPSQVRYISDTGHCNQALSKLSCALGTLDAVGNPSTIVHIRAQAIQSIPNANATFIVTGNGTDTNNTNNADSANVTITGDMADIVVTITDSGNPAVLNKPFTFTIKVANNGPNIAAVKLTGILESAANAIINNPCGLATKIDCVLDPLESGAEDSVVIEITPTELGTLSLVVEAVPPLDERGQGGFYYDPTIPNIATREVTVSNAIADLEVTLETNPPVPFIEKNFSYTVTVLNKGPSDATGVVLQQTLPLTDIEFISTESSQGTTCTQTENVITCQLGTINKDDTATLVTKIRPLIVGKYNTAVAANSPIFDPVQSNNKLEVETIVSEYNSDLSLTVNSDPNPVLVANPLTYTMTIKNVGPDVATGIVLTNTLSENVTFLAATVEPAGSCIPLDKEGTGGIVTCSIENLALDKTASVTLITQPDIAGTVTNVAQIQSLESDPVLENNTVTSENRVVMPASLFFVEAQKNGIAGVNGLNRVNDITLSPDGLHLYAVGFNDNSLVVFSRDIKTGTLSFAQVLLDGSNGVDGLAAASSVAVSPDGTFVYATGFSDNAISVHAVNPTTGALEFKKVYKDGLEGIDGIAGAFSVIVTANHVYVAGVTDDAIAVFSRDQSGELTFVEKIASSDTVLLDGVSHLTISQDGTNVLATSTNSGNLTVFSRDLSTGQLTYLQTLTEGIESVEGLKSVNSVIISSEGKHVYTTGGGSNSGIAIFERAQTGLLTYKTIIRNGDAQNLTGAFGIALTPMGNYLYVASTGDSALVVFKRDATTGLLTYTDSLTDGQNGVDGLGGARAVAIDPTGIHIYVAGFTDNGVGVLRIASADVAVFITESEDPVSVGRNLTYTVTVENHGPDQATNVRLFDTLPDSVDLVSYTPSQGICHIEAQNMLNCVLGTLNKDGKLTVTIVVTPTKTAKLINSVNVSASQFDPISPSSATVETEAAATADLTVTVATTPNPVVVASPMSYQFTIVNQGPDAASTVVLVHTLPASLEFISAQIDGNAEACFYFADKVTCNLASLSKDASSIVTITAKPNQKGVVTSSTQITSQSFDPDAPTIINKEINVLLNIIEGAYDNTGKTLTNYIIDVAGWVKGGNLAGHITNFGLLSDVHILKDTLVTGGGELWHTITNDGIIDGAKLQADTTINGGILQGKIIGKDANNPATLNGVQVAAGAELSHVILGVGCSLDPSVKLVTNVKFASNANIPAGIDLTAALPYIYDAISHRGLVNLYTDVLVGTENTLLNEINALPDLKNNSLAFTQSPETGVLFLVLGEEHIILAPIAVTQSTQIAGITVNPDGSVLFVTATGRAVLTQPALENPLALETMLNNWGIAGFTAYADGNIKTATLGQYYYLARPDKTATKTEIGEGITMFPATLSTQLNLTALHYTDNMGVFRQQLLYPSAAHPAELKAALTELPGAKNLLFYNNGSLSVTLNEVTYTAMYDYKVETGSANGFTQFLSIADQNGDGSEDIKVIYSNGDQQILYLLPLPSIISELQAIPDIYYGGYLVSQEVTGDLLFYQGSTRILLRTNYVDQLPAGTLPKVMLHSDGSVEFITQSARQLFAQPMVQDWRGLERAVQQRGFQSLSWQEDGNLRLVQNEFLTFEARPDLSAPLTTMETPIGLAEQPSQVLNQPNLSLVFIDPLGNKRQQTLYPAIKNRADLYTFFSQMPNITGVRFEHSGYVELAENDKLIKGIAAYQIESTELATGGIQFTQVADINGDFIPDFMLVHANGDKQIIYQLP